MTLKRLYNEWFLRHLSVPLAQSELRVFQFGFETKGSFRESKLVDHKKWLKYALFYPKGRAKPNMARRRGNPNWGKPEPIGPVIPVVTSFEQAVKEFKLTPDQYIRSTRLREWARRNKNSKYIPEPLLEAWGFEIESTL